VERISAMIDSLLEAKRLFEEDRAAAQADYEAKIEEMRQQYEEVPSKLSLYSYNLITRVCQ
jgi:F0F1-type ATP synthase membrane subunit b/b'